MENFIGKQFGKLTIIKQEGSVVEAKCNCDSNIIWRGYISILKKGNTKSCGHCKNPKIGDKFGILTIIEILKNNSAGCKVKAQCECGRIWIGYPCHLRNHNNNSCGKCKYREKITGKTHSIDITGQRFGKLIALERINHSDKLSKTNDNIWSCQCDCGTYIETKTTFLLKGDTKSCRKCGYVRSGLSNRIDITNKKFGKLKAIKPLYSKNNSWIWQCLCDCGRIHNIPAGVLTSGNTKSCGNCGTVRNGHNTSWMALSLLQLLPISAIHNYPWGPKAKNGRRLAIDWAFVYKGKKVALEYDEWYNHGYKVEQDLKRYKKLVRLGWCVIRIKAHNNIPTQKQIDKALDLIASGRKKVTITLKGWGKGPTRADIKLLQTT